MNARLLLLPLLLSCALRTQPTGASEIAELAPTTWKEFVPRGKEIDCIYGDYVLRNDRLVAVIAKPVAGRNANMTVRDVGGCLIDLTERQQQSDQLSAYYPGGGRYLFQSGEVQVTVDGQPATAGQGALQGAGKTVTLRCTAPASQGKPEVVVEYKLTDGQPYLVVTTTYKNTGQQPLDEELVDAIRADRTFTFGTSSESGLFWAYDPWFRQAYGVLAEGRTIQGSGGRGQLLRLSTPEGARQATIAPGQSLSVARQIFPAADSLGVQAIARQLQGDRLRSVKVTVSDPNGPVRGARLSAMQGDEEYASGRTNGEGELSFELPQEDYQLRIIALGRPPQTLALSADAEPDHQVRMKACGYVAARVTDDEDQPIPCKVAFHGRAGTESPFFGPDSAAVAVHNLVYSHDGRFRQEIGPGQYDVIISYGPEYDAVFKEIVVQRGETTRLEARLVRSVDTRGWVSSDFHSHSSPSGDNTASQFGRVLNLLCEHIEFAPCTEHNRLSTYVPHLKRIECEDRMATCVGMELTGSPLPVNHQNAFPLVRKPRTQDGGAPQTDTNPVVQIERLALWDGGSEKLVQQNHPNIVQILSDRDLDGQYDSGFQEMFGFMDVIEVHPPADIFEWPEPQPAGKDERHAMFRWLQLLNLGYRIPGVVNTDAHYNFHGSGGLRNYLKSPTDEPASIDTLDMVRAAEAGHVIMTNGPFLEVSARARQGQQQPAIPGDDLRASDGELDLKIRVQCASWLDINRVQVFLNGRPVDRLNFTRRQGSQHFQDGVVKFEATIPLELQSDAHIIVACAGEGLQLAPVMGSNWEQQMPVAVSNPIFVDTDGNGFHANGDLLGRPIPTQ